MSYNDIAERKALVALENDQTKEALTLLMQAYGDDIYDFCLSMLQNTADAQDTLQLVFVQAYKGLTNFKKEATFRTWLYSIARNRSLDLAKGNRRLHDRIEFVSEAPENIADEYIDTNGTQDYLSKRILMKCVNKLKTPAREAIIFRFQTELSYEEAALVSNVKAGTLQARVARALPILRRCVEENGLVL